MNNYKIISNKLYEKFADEVNFSVLENTEYKSKINII